MDAETKNSEDSCITRMMKCVSEQYNYFANSPKQLENFDKWSEAVETLLEDCPTEVLKVQKFKRFHDIR